MKNFCISTLTHVAPRRSEFLQTTVEAVLKNTRFDENILNDKGKIDWFLRINGKNKAFLEEISSLVKKTSDKIEWHLEIGDNTGVGTGINSLNRLTREYRYNLFLEGDWECLSQEIGGGGEEWLIESILLLENNDLDTVVFRRFTSDVEDRQYSLGCWIVNSNIEKELKLQNSNFILLKKYFYTNNPTLRKVNSYYEKQIFPLDEFFDEKGNPTEIKIYNEDRLLSHEKDWGRAEVNAFEKGYKLKTAYYWPGKFTHIENWTEKLMKIQVGACKYKVGASPCKYSFFQAHTGFCVTCDKRENFSKLSEHQTRYTQSFLKLVDSKEMLTEEDVYGILQSLDIEPEAANVQELVKLLVLKKGYNQLFSM
jgi:hypothetical protein